MHNIERYNIIRFFADGDRAVLRHNVTRQAAQAHCKDPETSSTTCTSDEGTARTQEYGNWFDGFERSN